MAEAESCSSHSDEEKKDNSQSTTFTEKPGVPEVKPSNKFENLEQHTGASLGRKHLKLERCW